MLVIRNVFIITVFQISLFFDIYASIWFPVTNYFFETSCWFWLRTLDLLQNWALAQSSPVPICQLTLARSLFFPRLAAIWATG
jgi:predicted membrane channel-forming protein YqfA (hemolysin III family)